MSVKLPVRLAADLAVVAEEQRWLVRDLWAAQAVGIVGGEPKCCLCRARHKQHNAASPVMPRRSESAGFGGPAAPTNPA